MVMARPLTTEPKAQSAGNRAPVQHGLPGAGAFRAPRHYITEGAESALEIIKWFNNHSTALDLLYKEQILSQLEHVLALLVPVVTRWTSHYLSICRLLKVSSPLRTVVVRMEDRLRVAAGSKREQVEKAESIIAMVRNDALWLALTRYSFLSHSLSPPGHSHDFSQN